jgi:hypothetical protein
MPKSKQSKSQRSKPSSQIQIKSKIQNLGKADNFKDDYLQKTFEN